METRLQKAYDNSYYTVLGCGGDIDEWKDGYNKLIKENVYSDFDINQEDVIIFTGKDMNRFSRLKGDNTYPDDLTCMAFSYKTCKNVGGLAMFKLRMQDRWFDDVVDNDRRR